MNILIRNTNALQSMIQRNKVLWTLQAKTYLKYILFAITTGLVFLVIGLASGFTFKSKADSTTTVYNLHIATIIGLSFILMGMLYSIHMYRNKRIFFESVDKYINRHSLDPADGSIQIDDNGITFLSNEIKQDIKWKRFSHFKYYRGFLFLFMDDYSLQSISIDKKQVSDHDFAELLDFLKKNLQESK